MVSVFVLYFFFSSRRRHTRFSRDWSSDVCSSDLVGLTLAAIALGGCGGGEPSGTDPGTAPTGIRFLAEGEDDGFARSEERRVGKSVDLGGRRMIKKKKREEVRKYGSTNDETGS